MYIGELIRRHEYRDRLRIAGRVAAALVAILMLYAVVCGRVVPPPSSAGYIDLRALWYIPWRPRPKKSRPIGDWPRVCRERVTVSYG